MCAIDARTSSAILPTTLIAGGIALLIGELLNAKEGYWWFVLAVAALAYYLSKGTPLVKYLASPQFATDVAAAQAVALSKVAFDAIPATAPVGDLLARTD